MKYWNEFCKSGNKPDDLPTHPDRTYKNKGWINWGDFLGTGRVADQKKKYRSFEEARKFVRSLKLKDNSEWKKFTKSGNKPNDIPANPYQTYTNHGWKGIPDWLGNGNLSSIDRKYVTYEKCQKFVHNLQITNQKEWEIYQKNNKKPKNIPSHPDRIYKNEWRGWGTFLGTGRVANQEKQYRSFEDAREFVRKLGIKNQKEWKEYCMFGDKPDDIPSAPWHVYKKWKKK